jgi:hypothetical protein
MKSREDWGEEKVGRNNGNKNKIIKILSIIIIK